MTHKLLLAAAITATLTACQTPTQTATTNPSTPAISESPATAPAPLATPAVALPTIRIKAGSETAVTDAKGSTWAPDSGFEGGANVDRTDATVTGTDQPELFKSEHHSMDSFSQKLPNGNYTLKLFFAENYDGISDETGRVFTFTIKDGDPATGKTLKESKDFSPWKAAGAKSKAYIDSTNITITTGQLSITFTPQTNHPEINALEITPQ